MRTIILILTFLFSVSCVFAQVRLAGKVTDEKQLPLAGANIFLQGTYDGTTADSLGNFSFKPKLKGIQTMSVTFIGYKPLLRKVDLDSAKTIVVNIVM